MRLNYLGLFIISFSLISGCASVSSSSVPYLAHKDQTKGSIFLTQSNLPSNINYKTVGIVKANARTGYDNPEMLYPMLINEAKKIGANAVINVYSGRTVSAFSWGAPYVGGTAIKINDVNLLKNQYGEFYNP